jgi:D-3-phosphoglycerate dehydrogenase
MIQKPKIIIGETQDFSPEVVKELSRFAEVELKDCDIQEIPKALQECDVFWFRLAHKIDRSILTTPNLRCKILATPVTGIDHIDENACAEAGIKIICLRGETEFLRTVRATAEMTVALALALMRNLAEANISVNSGIWNRDLFRGNELFGKTAGIIGYGRLGNIVADYFKAFGMKVIVYDITQVKIAENIELVKSIEELVSQSDLISLHVNYNSANHHLINKDVFSKFKKDSFFINTSRGGIVDEIALLTVLENNLIKGAALDVLSGEPNITIEHPLIRYAQKNKNLLIVPHIGGNTYESFYKTENFIATKVLEEIKKLS